jgi:MOB kinase activator 1
MQFLAIEFFQEISLLHALISESCTDQTCPIMSAGEFYQYFWADDDAIKKQLKVSAPDWITLCFTWIESLINDESLFPVSPGTPFPKSFLDHVKSICTKIARIYAHFYLSHSQVFIDQEADAHLNTCFRYFVYFCYHFSLVSIKEFAPVAPIVVGMFSNEGTMKMLDLDPKEPSKEHSRDSPTMKTGVGATDPLVFSYSAAEFAKASVPTVAKSMPRPQVDFSSSESKDTILDVPSMKSLGHDDDMSPIYDSDPGSQNEYSYSRSK